MDLGLNKEGISYKYVWICLAVLIFLQTIYAAVFIERTSFVVEGQKYYCLFDDAMISMRYADNWAHGRGLVWNVGEKVEGYTNPAWTIIMGLVHLLNLSPSHTCLAIQILGIIICWGCLFGTTVLAKNCYLTPAAAICALCLSATFYVLLYFSLFGMETGLLTFLVTMALASAVKCINLSKASSVPMLWFCGAFLVRMDVLPIAFFTAAIIFLYAKQNRYQVLIGTAVLVSTAAALFLARHSYYGHWFPNTYYLKATNWPIDKRILSGIKYARWTFVMFIVPAVFAFAALSKFHKKHILLISPMVILCTYQTYVGGDAWPLNRLVIPAALALFILTAEGIAIASDTIAQKIKNIPNNLLLISFTIICVISINITESDEILFKARPYSAWDNRHNIMITHAVGKISKPDNTILVGYAGTVPYFTKYRCFDILGKCDEYIARTPVLPNKNRPGHNKYDLYYSINTYKPDIMPHTMFHNPQDYITSAYTPVIVTVDEADIPLMVKNNSCDLEYAETVSWMKYEQKFRYFEGISHSDF